MPVVSTLPECPLMPVVFTSPGGPSTPVSSRSPFFGVCSKLVVSISTFSGVRSRPVTFILSPGTAFLTVTVGRLSSNNNDGSENITKK